jgi:hypothetical protein
MLKRRTSEHRGAKAGPGRSQLLIQAFQASNKLSLSKPGKSLQGTGTQRLLLACQVLEAGGMAAVGAAGGAAAGVGAGAAASGCDAGHGGRGVLIAQEASQRLPQIISSVFANRE